MSEERTYYLTFDDLSTDRLYDLIKYHKEIDSVNIIY
jgi:hypothetical protein